MTQVPPRKIWRRAEPTVVKGDASTLDVLLRHNGEMLRTGPIESTWRGGLAPDYSMGDARAVIAMEMIAHTTRSVFERYNSVSECDLVQPAKKLNVRQPANLPAEAGSHTSERDRLASPKRRSGEGGHNSGTVGPDRGRLKVSL